MAWPSPYKGTTQLLLNDQTWMKLPVVPTSEAEDHACELPPPQISPQAPFGKGLTAQGPDSHAERNDATGDSTFTTTSAASWMLHGNHFQLDEFYRWYVNDERPDQAQYRAQRRNVFKVEGVEIDLATQASIDSDMTHFHITFSNVLKRNGTLVRERTWVDQIPRHYQ